MINVEEFKFANIDNILVEPSSNLFKELGNNTYDFLDLISELIDNSIAARTNKDILKIKIELGLSESEKSKSYLIIRDNAKGIERKDLGKCLSPAAKSGGSTLNEHGCGMKQAIAALGNLRYLATKTNNDREAIVVEELKYGQIFPKLIDVEWENGTEICVDNLKPIVPRNTQVYTKSISTYLGARYRRFLKPENTEMKLELVLLDLDDIDQNSKMPVVIKEWDIKELKPVYFHPNKRRNEPIILNRRFKGKGWEANLTFGYAPKEDEYNEMGLENPKTYEPYKVGISRQGFDLIRNMRVIKFHQLSEIGIISTKHSKYNYIRGEIDLINGFITAVTKNHIIFDDNFQELISQVKEYLEEKNI